MRDSKGASNSTAEAVASKASVAYRRVSIFSNAFLHERSGGCLHATGECLQADDALPKGWVKIPLTLIADPVTIAFIANDDVVRVKIPVSALQSP